MGLDKDLKIFLVTDKKGNSFQYYALAYSKDHLLKFLKDTNLDTGSENINRVIAYHKIIYCDDTNTYEILYYAPYLRNNILCSPRYVVTRPINSTPPLPFMDELGENLSSFPQSDFKIKD